MFRKERKVHKNMGRGIQHNTSNTYENGDKCVRIWKRGEMRIRVSIHTRRMQSDKRADRKGGQTYEQGHAYNKSTVPKIFIEFAGKEEREQKRGYEYKTKHKPRRARNTGRKTGREESIQTRHRLIETGKQTRKVRERDRDCYW